MSVIGNPITLGGGGSAAQFKLLKSVSITAYASYNTFKNFTDAVFPDLDLATGSYVAVFDFVNNTNNTRAGVYAMAWLLPMWPVAYPPYNLTGKRVGGTLESVNFGVNVYAGATINLYISYFPSTT